MAGQDAFYREKAEECEERASEMRDAGQRDEWLKMAEDWRSMLLGDVPRSANED